MKTSSSRRLAMTAAALLGCLTAAGPALAQGQCSPGDCRITVTVNNCSIAVSPDPVVVNSPRNMRWEIVTPGYTFPADGSGIQFGDPQFELRNSPQANQVHIFNQKTRTGDFKYNVNVTASNGGACSLDPTVRNN